MMRRKVLQCLRYGVLACLSLTMTAVAIAQSSSGRKGGDEAAIRQLDEQWSNDAASMNVDKTVSYYADDASLLAPNAPIATGKSAITAAWKEMLVPGTKISWKATKVEVAKSGDLAYLMGTYDVSMPGPQGKTINDKGKLVEVWKKQPNKQWKVVADIFNSDLPMPGAENK